MRNIMAGGNYEHLTPRERLTLFTQAKARADEGEMKRLIDTAPMQTWRLVDHDFTRGRDVLWDIIHVVCIQLNENVGKLHIIDKMQRITAPVLQLATMETVPKVLDALSEDAKEQMARHMSGMVGKSAATFDIASDNGEAETGESLTKEEWGRVLDALTTEARQTVGGIIGGLREDVKRDAAAILASFDRLTRKVLDMDGLTVLRAWAPPIAEAIEEHDIPGCTPDSEAVELWAPVWAQSWNRRMGIKATPENNGDGNENYT